MDVWAEKNKRTGMFIRHYRVGCLPVTKHKSAVSSHCYKFDGESNMVPRSNAEIEHGSNSKGPGGFGGRILPPWVATLLGILDEIQKNCEILY